MKECKSQDHIGNRMLPDQDFKCNVTKSNPTGVTTVCKGCLSIRRRRERIKNSARVRDEQRRWREINESYKKQYDKKYRESEHGKQIRSQSYERNREQKRTYDKERWTTDPTVRARHAQVCAKRRAMLIRAIPSWANEEIDHIKETYIQRSRISAETGIEHHVDHIVPIQSDIVCGLHCRANLRIIPATDNIAKSNRLDEDLIYNLWIQDTREVIR